MPDFCVCMARIRRKKKISQEELSRKSGVSQAAISMIEAGKRSPTEAVMKMLAKALGVSLRDLLQEDENEKSPPQKSDGLREEVVSLLLDLPEEELQQMRDYAAFLKSRRGKG